MCVKLHWGEGHQSNFHIRAEVWHDVGGHARAMTSSSVLTAAECFHLEQNQAGENRFWKNCFWRPFPYSRAVAPWPSCPSWWDKNKPQGWNISTSREGKKKYTLRIGETLWSWVTSNSFYLHKSVRTFRRLEKGGAVGRNKAAIVAFFFLLTGAKISRGRGNSPKNKAG